MRTETLRVGHTLYGFDRHELNGLNYKLVGGTSNNVIELHNIEEGINRDYCSLRPWRVKLDGSFLNRKDGRPRQFETNRSALQTALKEIANMGPEEK